MNWLEKTFLISEDKPKPLNSSVFYEVAENASILSGKSLQEELDETMRLVEESFATNYPKNRSGYLILAGRLTGVPVEIVRPRGLLADSDNYVGVKLDKQYDYSNFWLMVKKLMEKSNV